MCAHFSISAQCQIPYCYACGFISASATQGEWPERQEKVPWGIAVSRNSFTRYYRQFLRVTPIDKLYRRVRQGELPVRAREDALGYDPARHNPSELHDLSRRGNVVHMILRFGAPRSSRPTDMFHFPLSIFNSLFARRQIKIFLPTIHFYSIMNIYKTRR